MIIKSLVLISLTIFSWFGVCGLFEQRYGLHDVNSRRLAVSIYDSAYAAMGRQIWMGKLLLLLLCLQKLFIFTRSQLKILFSESPNIGSATKKKDIHDVIIMLRHYYLSDE